MDISKIAIGKNPPHDINVIIEIPQGVAPVKYEMDKDSGALFVDRFLTTSMVYPTNYGFIPHTLSADGDPCDVNVICQFPLVPGSVVRVRPIGALIMEDESGMDEKILAVPVEKLNPFYADVKSIKDLPQILLDQISHFYERYKDLEKGKWVKVVKWVDAAEAGAIIEEGIKNAKK